VFWIWQVQSVILLESSWCHKISSYIQCQLQLLSLYLPWKEVVVPSFPEYLACKTRFCYCSSVSRCINHTIICHMFRSCAEYCEKTWHHSTFEIANQSDILWWCMYKQCRGTGFLYSQEVNFARCYHHTLRQCRWSICVFSCIIQLHHHWHMYGICYHKNIR
jgi:hypothetical protein